MSVNSRLMLISETDQSVSAMGNQQQRDLSCLALVFSLLTSSSGARIRLSGFGSTRCSGRVEISYNNTWGTVCDDGWDLKDAGVVCREMGCGTALRATTMAAFGEGGDQIWLDDLECSGSEGSLSECPHRGFGIHDCGHIEDAGVICSGYRIRLTGFGSTRCSGRVEISYNNTWGTVCDDGWDLKDAGVVCRELGCGTALRATTMAAFGKGGGQIWLDDLECSGSEGSLSECPHRGFGIHDCGHSEDAGVVCSASLLKPSISMIPPGEVTWGQDVSITCSISTQHLDGTFILQKTPGSFRRTQTSSNSSATFSVSKVTFDDEGVYQCQFQTLVLNKNFGSNLSDPSTLHVTVTLPQPSISLASPNRGLVWRPEGAEVAMGYSFVFTCSIHSSYPTGVFHLLYSGSRVSHNTTRTAVNHSASFYFTGATLEHQGSYTCFYEVMNKFISPGTAPLVVIIDAPLLPLVSSVTVGVLLLLLLVLLAVCLVLRRRRAEQHDALAQTQSQCTPQTLALSVRNCSDDADEDDYVNVDPMNTEKKFQFDVVEEEKSDIYEEPDSHGDNVYEEAGPSVGYRKTKGQYFGVPVNREVEDDEEEEEDSPDNEDIYENVTR